VKEIILNTASAARQLFAIQVISNTFCCFGRISLFKMNFRSRSPVYYGILKREVNNSKTNPDPQHFRKNANHKISKTNSFYSTAEYCAPAWCLSKRTRLVDKPMHDALQLVTRCLRPNATNNLFILAGIIPTELRWKRAIYTVSIPPCNGPIALSRRSTLIHTNYTRARTQIETSFWPCCAGTWKI